MNRYGLAERFPDVYKKLKELRFGEDSDVKTEKRVKEFYEFIEKYGRLPKSGVKGEKPLYAWCGSVWRNNKGLADRLPEVYDKLKELRWGESVNIQTESIAASFWEFVEKNGRLPKRSVKGERPLYSWCVRIGNNQNGLADRFPDVWNKMRELGWMTKDEKTEARVEEFWEFVGLHGRLPRPTVKEENSLWQWCGCVWHNQFGLADRFPEVYSKLKELRFGDGRNLKTEKRVKEFWEFVGKYGRMPKQLVKEELSLYLWCRGVEKNRDGLADRIPDVFAKIKELKEKK